MEIKSVKATKETSTKTCADCRFNCSASDNETCERFKDKQLFGQYEPEQSKLC